MSSFSHFFVCLTEFHFLEIHSTGCIVSCLLLDSIHGGRGFNGQLFKHSHSDVLFQGCFNILFIMDKRCYAHQSAGVWEYKISCGQMPTRVIASLYSNTILLFI